MKCEKELKQLIFKSQRLLYSQLPFSPERKNDMSALALLETYRPNHSGFSHRNQNLPNLAGLELSILIPAYNVASYIRECLESVLSQRTSYTYEIIIIDDGSTDGTAAILDEFNAKWGSIITVLHQENRGIAATRNHLLNHARGEYIMFVDSDDILPSNAVDVLMRNTDNCSIDIVQGSYCNINENGTIISDSHVKMKPNYQGKLIGYAERLRYLSGFCWGKVIRRKIFRTARFIENIVFEDTLLHYVIYQVCNTAAIIPNEVYQYRLNGTSIMHSLQRDYKGIDTVYQVDALLALRLKLGLPMNNELYRMMLFQCGPILFNRTRHYGSDVLRSVFAHSANIICSLGINTNLTCNQKYIEEAFRSYNFRLWKSCSRIPMER